MTKQMAINFLDYKAFCLHNDPNVKSDDAEEIINMSIDALGKQIAKKPYIEENAGFKLYHCPGCEMPIFAGTEYCSDCGQKLLRKWGE